MIIRDRTKKSVLPTSGFWVNRNRHKYFFCLIASVALPLFSLVEITIKPSVAQESRVENNIIYVDSQVGNDNNEGAKNTPLKTITQALKIAPHNTTISLAPGTYSKESGETFPLIIKRSITLKGIAGGQGSNIIIQGSGTFISPSAAEQNVTIAAIKKAQMITGITVINPDNRGHGVWIESANPQISYNSFVRNGHAGLSVNGNSQATITNNYFRQNGSEGLLVHGTSTAIVENNVFDSTGFGVSVVDKAASLLKSNTFKGNRIGIIFEGNSQGILQNNEIFDSWEFGLVAIANSQVNLGDFDKPGNNTFRNNKKLDIQNVTAHTISATGTEINGQTIGNIDFSDRASSSISLASITSNDNSTVVTSSRLRNNPLPDKQASNNISSESTVTNSPNNNQALSPPPSIGNLNNDVNTNSSESTVTNSPNNSQALPPPPSIGNLNNDVNTNSSESSDTIPKEYVFSAPESKSNFVTHITPLPPAKNDVNSGEVNTLSDLLTSFDTPVARYRVLVEVDNDSQKSRVKVLYPDAFTTVYRGKPMLQIGAFSDRSSAEKISHSIANLGLSYHILE